MTATAVPSQSEDRDFSNIQQRQITYQCFQIEDIHPPPLRNQEVLVRKWDNGRWVNSHKPNTPTTAHHTTPTINNLDNHITVVLLILI